MKKRKAGKTTKNTKVASIGCRMCSSNPTMLAKWTKAVSVRRKVFSQNK